MPPLLDWQRRLNYRADPSHPTIKEMFYPSQMMNGVSNFGDLALRSFMSIKTKIGRFDKLSFHSFYVALLGVFWALNAIANFCRQSDALHFSSLTVNKSFNLRAHKVRAGRERDG